MRASYTYAIMEVSPRVHAEVRRRLVEADHDHAVHAGDSEFGEVLDMRGIALAVEREADRPLVVCLCGSTRFRQAWTDATREKSLDGEIVLSVGVMIHAGASPIPHISPAKKRLDELHLRKIDLADYVYVLNVGGYVGESTKNEIEYALSVGKRIEYLEPLS